MKAKHILAGSLLGLSLIIITPVYAEDTATLTTDGETCTTNVTYTKGSSFSVSIPLLVSLSEEDTEFQITSSNMNIRPDEAVYVAITDGITDDNKVVLYRQNVPLLKPIATLDTFLYRHDAEGTKIDITKNASIVARFLDSDAPTTNLYGPTYATGLNITSDTESGDYLGTVTFEITKITE